MCPSEDSPAWKYRLSLNIQILMLMLITQPHPIPRVIRLAVAHFCWFLTLYFIETPHPCPDVSRERPFWFWNTASISVALPRILQELEINCSPCQENWNTTWSLDARDPYHHSCRVTRGGWGWYTPGWKTGFPAEMLLEPQNTTAISDPALSSPLGGWGGGSEPRSAAHRPTVPQRPCSKVETCLCHYRSEHCYHLTEV